MPEERCALLLIFFFILGSNIFFGLNARAKGTIAVERRKKWMGKKLTQNLVEKKIREKLSMTIWDLLDFFFNIPN